MNNFFGNASSNAFSGGTNEVPDDINLADWENLRTLSSINGASTVKTITTNFNKVLSIADDTIQKSLDTLDDHTHAAQTAAQTATDTTNFNNILTSGDTDVQKALDRLDEANQYNPTGFVNGTQSKITFGATTFTIEPAVMGQPFMFYVGGKYYSKTDTHTVNRIETTGLQYIYFDANGVLQISITPWVIRQTAFVAIIYWSQAQNQMIYTADERHTINMSSATHSYLHWTVGTRYSSGLTLTGTTSGNGDNNTHAQIAITPGVVYDEDLRIEITTPYNANVNFSQNLSIPAELPVMFRTGPGAEWQQYTTQIAFPFYTANDNTLPKYNKNTANTWTMEPVPTGNMFASWIFATNSIKYPLVVIPGQRTDNSQSGALSANNPDTINFGTLPFAEMKLLYRLIFGCSNAYASTCKTILMIITDYRNVSNLPSQSYLATAHSSLTGLSEINTHPASAISINTAAFDNFLSAADDTVQKALDKIDNNLFVKFAGTTEFQSVGVGYATLSALAGGWNNTALGLEALKLASTGHTNVCIGAHAGALITTGQQNVCIGGWTNTAAADTNNAIALGDSVVAATNNIVIGNAAHTLMTLKAANIYADGIIRAKAVGQPRQIVLWESDANDATNFHGIGMQGAGPRFQCDNFAASFHAFYQGTNELARIGGTGTIFNTFTKLGSDAPAIKQKHFTGTFDANYPTGKLTQIAHGLNLAKVIRSTATISSPGNVNKYPPFFPNIPSIFYLFNVGNTYINLQTILNGGEDIHNGTYDVVIDYTA